MYSADDRSGPGVQKFKGCILITIRHFVNVLYGKTDRFHIPTNLPAIADLLGYARSVHDRRGRRVWNMVFGNYVANPAFFYEDFGSSILSLSLTLVCDSARPASLFRSNWPLRRSEAALNVEPCRRSRLKRSGSGEPVNAYDVKHLKTNTRYSPR